MTYSTDNPLQFPPNNLVTTVWQELSRATKDRHHEWRTPALATVDSEGNPKVRTIVLRHADASAWTLQAYSDLRSPKCQQLMQSPCAQLVCWSVRRSWQLRISVHASVMVDGESVEKAWERMRQSKSSKDYLSPQAPGHVLATQNDAIDLQNSSNHHFLAVLSFQVLSMDWLALGKGLHRRAHIDASGIVTPLVP